MRDEERNGGVTTGDESSTMTVQQTLDADEVVVVRKWGKRKKISKKKNEIKRNKKCEFLLLEFALHLLKFGRKFRKKWN